jgi:hypothetical protein
MTAYLAEMTLHKQCVRFESMVLGWNEHDRLLPCLGATVFADSRICRMDEAQISQVAGNFAIANINGRDGRLHPRRDSRTSREQLIVRLEAHD